jgi:ssDNA-binding replication factor A large subunit
MFRTFMDQKPELEADKLYKLIEEKKRKIGAGYLTDQGALFLVGADLGVSFELGQKSKSTIKDLYVGARDVTVSGRILSVYSPRIFVRKDATNEVKSRTLVIYDKESNIKVKLWDKQVDLPEEMGLTPGKIIRISNASVRQGLDGKGILNVGSGSKIELVSELNSPIPDLNSLTLTIDDITKPQDNVIVTGHLKSSPRVSEFSNVRGEKGKSLLLLLVNGAGTRSLRTVIWNVNEERLPRVLSIGSRIKLIGVRIKPGNTQYGNGDFEIHGDEGTILEFPDTRTDMEVLQLRIISFGDEDRKGKVNCLAVQRDGSFVSVAIDVELFTENLTINSLIECAPARIFGTYVTLTKGDSYIRRIDEDRSFPDMTRFESKIKDISVSERPWIVEAIVLQAPNTIEVNTKAGESVSMTDTLIGDDTGEIRLVGWRDLSSTLNSLKVGDRVKLTGVIATNSIEGNIELLLKPYSSILRISC